MRLKIFLFPLAIAISLIVGVVNVQPEVMRAMSLTEENQMVDQTETDAKTRATNAATLAQALSSKASLEQSVVNQYLPQQPSGDTIVDMVNFLASQSGVILTGLDSQKIVEPIEVATPSATPKNQAGDSLDPKFLSSSGQAVQEEIVPAVGIRTMDVKVSGRGLYPNVKEFLRHVAYANYFNDIVEATIAQSQEIDSAEKIAPGTLSFNMTIRFSFMSPVKHFKNATAAGDGSIFLNQALNLKPVQHLNDFLARGASVVPNMAPIDGSGRENPFVK